MALHPSDYEMLLGAVNILNADSQLETLASRTLDSVISLIPNEILIFDGFSTDGNYTGPLWYRPHVPVPDERLQLLTERVHENPCYQGMIIRREQKPVRISQYMSLKEYHRTVLYNEFYRPYCGDTHMAVGLSVSPELRVACTMHRTKCDFTDRESKLLNLFAPHLVSAFRNAQFIQALNAERDQMGAALRAARYGIVTVDPDLNSRCQNPLASELLQKYFSSSDCLPDEVFRYVGHHRQKFTAGDFYLTPTPLEVNRKDCRLIIRLAFESQSQTVVLLLKEVRKPSPEDLCPLGLTRREAEMLFWLAGGKTNPEIGALCGISPRTVQKHLENIFPKLGVETRSAATAVALESLSKTS